MRPVSLVMFVLSLAFVGGQLFAQGSLYGKLAGKVLAKENDQPLPLANVTLKETQLGATCNERGEFVISPVPPGRYTVVGQLLGYEDVLVHGVVVERGKTTSITLRLVESAIPLEEVRVTADRVKRQEDIRPSVLGVAPVRAKTLAGVGEDVLRTLQAMPGVLAPHDFSSQLVIRGSGPDENLIIMDDIEVFNPYRLYGIISMFNPQTAADISLMTGGFPAKYGDRLSAVLEVTNKEGDKSVGLKGSLNASISNANLVLNGHSPFGINGSYVLSGRRTYYDLILGPIAKNNGLVSGDVAFPNFTDVQTKLVFEPSSEHKIIVNGITSRDGVDLVAGPDRSAPDSVNVEDVTRNDVIGVAWHHFPSKRFFSKLGASWYRNGGQTSFGGDFLDPSLNRTVYENGDTIGIRLFNVEFDSRYVFRKVSVKNEVGWYLDNHAIEAGAGLDFLQTSLIWHFRPDATFRAILLSRGVASIDNLVQTKDYFRVNLFLQDKIKISERLAIQPGLRMDYFEVLDRTYLQPRVNLSYAVDPLTMVRAAWGIYRQSPGYEKLLDQNAFFDLTNPSYSGLRAEQATHYVLGLERWIDNQWQVKLETYYKRFSKVIVQDIVQGTVWKATPLPGGDIRKPSGWTEPFATIGDSVTVRPINGATGRSYGLEVMIEKRNTRTDDRLTGWISYGLAKAERVRGDIITPFRFDQRHSINIVLDYRLNSWLDVGVRWKYGTNFVYTRPVGVQPRIIEVTENNQKKHVIQKDADGNVVFDFDRGGEANRYSGRLRPYHRLDIRLTANADYWGLDWDFYLDVINVYNRLNLLAYRFHIKDDLTVGTNEVNMLPILPTLGFSVRF